MKYLQKNDQKRKKERAATENAILFYGEESHNKIKKQELFSSDATNLNRICWHMEKEIRDISVNVNKQKFDIEKFLKIFITAMPNETSPLYISLRSFLSEIVEQHSTLYKELMSTDLRETQEDKMNHYQYFYLNTRNELLNICKLSEEKSINKVLNCLVYICYVEKEFIDNDNAKNILWNCFADEMISRAKEDFTDKDIDFSGIETRVSKTRDLQKRKLSKYLEEKPLCIQELEENNKEYNPIIIRKEDIKWINEKISSKTLTECGIKISREYDLKKLYSVLMVISKRLESDRIVGKKKQKAHCINSFSIHQNSNNHINYTAIAKLCGYDDYQRKNIKQHLRELVLLGVISVSDNCMFNIRVKVIYDKFNITENVKDSCVPIDDYKMACKEILKFVRVA